MNSALVQTNASPGSDPIRLLVHGFTPEERQMLNAFVKLTWRHGPRIELLSMDEVQQADAVMIDAADPTTRGWLKSFPWMKSESVIWVDANEVSDEVANGSTVLQRPVLWSSLPILLHKILARTSQDTGPYRTVVSPVNAAQSSVLVVDDSLAVRSMLRSLLEGKGHTVTDVDNANDAITLVAENRYSCVLLDVLMPGMDGYEACRKIKAHAYGSTAPPVVMLTSKSSAFDKIRGKMVGCDAYLTKPVKQEDLLDVISGVTARWPMIQQP